MKLKLGFVSNSSSSSFFLIGIEVKELNVETIEKMEDDENFKLDYLCDDDCGINLIGDLYTVYDDDYDCKTFGLNIDDIFEQIKKFYPDTKKEDIKLYCGMRAT